MTTTPQDLAEKIELLYQQTINSEKDSKDRAVKEFILRRLTDQYYKLTGDYYRREWKGEKKI